MQQQIQLSGWKAIAAVVILITVVVVRLTTFSDQRGNTALMQKLEVQVASDYLPGQVDRLRQALQSGDRDIQAAGAEAVLSSEITYHAVQTAWPLFDFSSSKEVVVRVEYSLDDRFGAGPVTTKYFLFRYGGLADSWSYQREVSALKFYMNFL